ncbi:GNAT family N-acetyltransferase [Kitasatospora sp. RB6PN24]|uniref:GNAT family N-acetyltransferase n=1 Tax=Kitasatospora humi TaxID=2893891 RepID=UPI001E5CAF44|nr:GNAT family protein [Kitasatospora humi]MCC9309674.1 GNAT family N-acetyltransferase [Kitasatospora humi]
MRSAMFFSHRRTEDAVLVPRTVAIADAYHAALAANNARFAEFEGRGLIRRAAELLIEHAFGPLGLRRVGLRTVVDNVRSRALAERLGFVRESVLPQGAVLADGPRDLVVYGLSPEAWAARRA